MVNNPNLMCVVLCTNVSGGTCFGVVAKRRMIVACKNTNTPTDAMTFASGGDVRSGRNTKKCRMSPSKMHKPSEMSSAGQKLIESPNESSTGMVGAPAPNSFDG